MEKIYPMRINKYLAFKGVCTRREADELIRQKKVLLNGKIAVLGAPVREKDTVEVRGMEGKKYLYFAYNKPVGVETSSPKEGLFPLGRLDKNSEGLIILTNDGRITDKLLNPEFSHEKEYLVQTKEKLRGSFKQKMEAGVNIEGYLTRKCRVQIINNFTFKIILTEGKKHQIRRMCAALFQEVATLKRIRIMNIRLGNLKSNSLRPIENKELETLLRALDLTK
jgi:23S rRNA pseudouridine2604 synthase